MKSSGTTECVLGTWSLGSHDPTDCHLPASPLPHSAPGRARTQEKLVLGACTSRPLGTGRGDSCPHPRLAALWPLQWVTRQGQGSPLPLSRYPMHPETDVVIPLGVSCLPQSESLGRRKTCLDGPALAGSRHIVQLLAGRETSRGSHLCTCTLAPAVAGGL